MLELVFWCGVIVAELFVLRDMNKSAYCQHFQGGTLATDELKKILQPGLEAVFRGDNK